MATRTYHASSTAAEMADNHRRNYHYINGTAPAQSDVLHHHINHQAGHSDNMASMVNQFSGLSVPAHIPSGPGAAQMQVSPQYLAAQEGTLAYAPGYGVPFHLGNMSQVPESYPSTAYAPHYPVHGIHGAYAPYPVPYPVVPYTPGRNVSYRGHNDVPALEKRRGSYSATESAPATPFVGGASDRGSAARVAIMRSTHNTPSPDHARVVGGFDRPVVTKSPTISDADLTALLLQAPAIPEAVPAVFTIPQHTKTLEQCLENRIVGNRNVYIRGLHPTTDDELLLKYAQRFGEVEQSKAIIDTNTGACKGFGFAKFANVRDSENCIRGFFQLRYEVHFAKESFNARLKAEGDENSTNLYLSNLPKQLTENDLNGIFDGYNIISSKILRDSMGNSRGVGFARFATRDECEHIIGKYHGIAVGDEAMLMQVRYADTPAQKELKRITAERRQFRTNEYNIRAYGTSEVGAHPTIYSQASWNRRQISAPSNLSVQRTPEPTLHASTVTSEAAQPGESTKEGATVLGTETPANGSDDESVSVADSHTVARTVIRSRSSPH